MSFRQCPWRWIALSLVGACCFGLAWHNTHRIDQNFSGRISETDFDIPELLSPVENEDANSLTSKVPSIPTPTPTVSMEFQWQEIFSDFYVYSLYPLALDSSEIHVTMIGPSDYSFWRDTLCQCIYYDEGNGMTRSNVTVSGRLAQLPEAHLSEHHNMIAGRLRCPFPGGAQNTTHTQVQCRRAAQSGAAFFLTPVVLTRPPPRLSFAHCGSPIFGMYNKDPALVVEFIEYYRLMGVTKFFWNGLEARDKLVNVLKYYEDQGVVQLNQWVLPWNETSGRSVHYYGQVAAQYDCVMKTAGLFDYTVICEFLKEQADFYLKQ